MASPAVFRNPHLDGTSFYWQAGPTGVLLFHGFTATTTEVRLLANSLHQHGYTVSAPLLPGHGTTPQDCNRHTWQDWYALAERSYQQLKAGCRQVVVGGESTGALLALKLAAEYPEVAAVLCYAPAMRLQVSRVKFFILTLCVPFLTSIPKAPSTDNNPWKGYTVNPLRGAYQLTSLQKLMPSILPKIHQPILILQGKLDKTVTLQSAQSVYDQVSSACKQLHWLENSSHCVILDQEHHLAASLTLDFLQHVLSP